jgi:hypothetical protein
VLDGSNRCQGFYDGLLNVGAIPQGAVPISTAIWQQWLKAQSEGQTLVYNQTTQQLSNFVPPAPTVDELLTYAYNKQAAVSGGGTTVNVAAQGQTPIYVTTSTSEQALSDLTGAAVLATLNPQQTFNWVENSGSVTLTAQQIIALSIGVGAFRQLTFTILGSIVAAINNGVINNYPQIDTPTSVNLQAWPTNAGMQATKTMVRNLTLKR